MAKNANNVPEKALQATAVLCREKAFLDHRVSVAMAIVRRVHSVGTTSVAVATVRCALRARVKSAEVLIVRCALHAAVKSVVEMIVRCAVFKSAAVAIVL